MEYVRRYKYKSVGPLTRHIDEFLNPGGLKQELYLILCVVSLLYHTKPRLHLAYLVYFMTTRHN